MTVKVIELRYPLPIQLIDYAIDFNDILPVLVNRTTAAGRTYILYVHYFKDR